MATRMETFHHYANNGVAVNNSNAEEPPGAPDANGLITITRDTDVLCGRGGAALRHPGNQTYRRLVNLNKGLYITCLKTEKLKISRSIVAAIREQNGRFLEKDPKGRGFFDIGDKKAIEKTSQALREGQPKLRRQIAEMGAAAVAAKGIPTTASAEATYETEQQFLQHQQHDSSMKPPPPMQQQHSQPMHHQQHFQQQQQQMLRQQELAAQQQHHAAFEQQRRLSSQSIEQQQRRSSSSSRRSHEMQSMVPPSPLTPSTTGTRQQELREDMLQRLTIHEMGMNHQHQQQQQRAESMTASAGSPQHSHHRHRLRPSLNARASLAHELGIEESQLSLMSDFSAFGGSMSSSGRASAGRTSNGSISIGSSGGPVGGVGGLVGGAGVAGGGTTTNESQGIMSIDSSFRRQLMGLPLGSIRTLNSEQMSMDNTSISTGVYTNHSTDMHFQNSSAAAAAAAAAAVNNPNAASRFDRRRVFAKMKYNRPPSVRPPTAAAAAAVHQQATGNSQLSLDEMPEFHMLESNMSVYSNLSNMTGQDAKPAATVTTPGTDPTSFSNDSRNSSGSSNNVPPAAAPFPTNKVIVETAKVVDHSSYRPGNALGDILGAGSRHSIMSGLSRISDSSIDHSIFSDLSRKIGNVSTRSMAMSEISAFDLQERENEVECNDFGNTMAVVGGPVYSYEQTKPTTMDFES